MERLRMERDPVLLALTVNVTLMSHGSDATLVASPRR